MPGGLLDLDGPLDWPWIVTYLYRISAPWGNTQVELTVNAPVVAGNGEATASLGRRLYEQTVATATSFLVRATAMEMRTWHDDGGAVVPFLPGLFGSLGGYPAGRAHSGCIVMSTDHNDRLDARRFLVPGIPERYVDDGLLTLDGRALMEGLAHRMEMGMGWLSGGAPLGAMIRYDARDLDGIPGAVAPRFRGLRRLYVTHHTARAPEPSPGLWG